MVALEPLIERGWLSAPELHTETFPWHEVDFAKVIPWRLQQLRAAAKGFDAVAKGEERADFDAWCQKNAEWLDDYALFMALETQQQGQGWWRWPVALARRDPVALARARSEHAAEIGFWQFVQWCFDAQCTALKAYANARGVAIMGDLPIFVAHHSADCWARPDL